MRKLLALLLLLCLALSLAGAEEIPELPERFKLTIIPKKLKLSVHTGPGYAVAADGAAKASTSDTIWCYGRAGNWLMIEYSISKGKNRIGYIDASAYADEIAAMAELSFADQPIMMKIAAGITDDPRGSGKTFGSISDRATLLAYFGDWAYVEGVLDNRDGEIARGFVRRDSFDMLDALPLMPDIPDADVTVAVLAETPLQTETLPTVSLRALPLPDDILAIVCCDEKSTILSLHSMTGKQLWSQRIFAASKYTALEAAKDGFTVSVYHNYQLLSYTFALGSREGVPDTDYISWEKLREAEAQSAAAQLMNIPVLRVAVVGEAAQGTLLLAAFDDGCGLYLLAAEGLHLVQAFDYTAELCSSMDANGVFSLVLWGEGLPVLTTYQCQ